MDIEVCAFSIESCLNAQAAGAHRVELCAGLYEGGTTPSYGMITRARHLLTIQLYVMIRPRGGDFCYDDEEFEVMKQDIIMAKSLGADGVVFGILLPNGGVDMARTKVLVELAHPLQVTFHRAFDRTIDAFQALEDIIEIGCQRILTSGQQPNALLGKDLLEKLVKRSQNRIEIMAGAGVSAQNALTLSQIGVHALHLTGKATKKGKMHYQNPQLTMASVINANEDEIVFSSLENIQAVHRIISKDQNP